MKDMRRTTLLYLTIAFSLIGIADAWYLAQHALTNTALSCGVGTLSGCNVVAQSAYSHFFGIPLGVYGVVFYTLMFVLATLDFAIEKRRLAKVLFGMGSIGVLFSFYFVWLQFFVIDAICIYCFVSFILSLGIFCTTFFLMRKRPLPSVTLT